jgi:hypothetical protein
MQYRSLAGTIVVIAALVCQALAFGAPACSVASAPCRVEAPCCCCCAGHGSSAPCHMPCCEKQPAAAAVTVAEDTVSPAVPSAPVAWSLPRPLASAPVGLLSLPHWVSAPAQPRSPRAPPVV